MKYLCKMVFWSVLTFEVGVALYFESFCIKRAKEMAKEHGYDDYKEYFKDVLNGKATIK